MDLVHVWLDDRILVQNFKWYHPHFHLKVKVTDFNLFYVKVLCQSF